MNTQEILMIFHDNLNVLADKNKYSRGIEDEDHEKALYALELTLDNPSLSTATLSEILAGERVGK
ncbi:MAG: hypothetical protein M0P74_13480 [Syntrophales bacterium]|jgi:hypothetical protein|nr:hypothetical protein [Syntrophales bacterium]